ncbi:hypothetical protein KIPB_010743, partial [Kipferlia bialata]
YSFDLCDDERDFVDAFAILQNYPGMEIPTENMIILTDALCGSTCSCFAKHAQESHSAVMVGLGGIASKYDEYQFDVSSFAGGSVLDSNYIQSQLTDDMHKTEGIPAPFPTDAYLRFAFEQVFSWDPEDYTSPLEFKVNPTDVQIPYWPRYMLHLNVCVAIPSEGPDAGFGPWMWALLIVLGIGFILAMAYIYKSGMVTKGLRKKEGRELLEETDATA